MKNLCFQCGAKGTDMYGHIICDTCKSALRLFTDDTIKKHMSQHDTYIQDIADRLVFIEQYYIKSKIKLLYIQERATLFSQND